MLMKYSVSILGLLVCLSLLLPSACLSAEHMIGGGVLYQKTLGDIKDNDEFDDDAINWIASYQLASDSPIKLEIDLEIVPDFGGSDMTFYMPQGYLLFGSRIYVGAGIGYGYLDGEWTNDPFYAFRGGLDLPLGEKVHLDINANYRFMDFAVLDDIDSQDADAITFGAILRFEL